MGTIAARYNRFDPSGQRRERFSSGGSHSVGMHSLLLRCVDDLGSAGRGFVLVLGFVSALLLGLSPVLILDCRLQLRRQGFVGYFRRSLERRSDHLDRKADAAMLGDIADLSLIHI